MKKQFGVMPGGPKLGTKERKKWLWTRAAYQEIPYKNLVPVEEVIKKLREYFTVYEREYKFTVAKGESDGNYDRIMIHFSKTDYHISFRPLGKLLTKYKFEIAQLYDFVDNRPELLCVRKTHWSVISK